MEAYELQEYRCFKIKYKLAMGEQLATNLQINSTEAAQKDLQMGRSPVEAKTENKTRIHRKNKDQQTSRMAKSGAISE